MALASIPVALAAPVAQQEAVQLPPELKRICSCESTGSPNNEPIHFNADGTVLRGRINSQDVGMCQINEHYWLEKSINLGFDIYTEEGNKQMALWLYDQQGNKPWTWSKKCWK